MMLERLHSFRDHVFGSIHEKAALSIPEVLKHLSFLLAFVGLDWIFLSFLSKLPYEAYEQPNILWQTFQFTFLSKKAIIALPLLGYIVVFGKKLAAPWSAFGGSPVRIWITVLAALLAWIYSSYDYNLYYGQGHYADRFLLIILAILVYWRPISVIPFLWVLLPVIHQFTSFSGFSWAIPMLPVELLIVFVSFLLIKPMTGKFDIPAFLLLTACLTAGCYFYSGSGKLNMYWVTQDKLYYLLPATYANGWAAFLPVSTINQIIPYLQWINTPLRVVTLILEVGAIFILILPGAKRIFLISWVGFHAGIFMYSGICFWVWSIVDIALLYVLRVAPHRFGFSHNYKLWTFSIIMIATASWWARPPRLVWKDSPVSYTYRFEAEAEDGAKFQLPPRFFAPYDYQFTLSGFSGLVSEKRLSIHWGSVGKASLAADLEGLQSVEEFFAYESENGHKPGQEKQMRSFLTQFVTHWNARQSKSTPFAIIQPPRYLWTFPNSTDYPQQSITKITVREVTSFLLDGQYHEIRNEEVQAFDITNISP